MIDLGCLPDTPFPHLEEAVGALKERRLTSRASTPPIPTSCCAAARPAPTFCSASTRRRCTSPIEVASTPVLIPKDHGDLASLYRAMDALDEKGRAYLADPVLDPINFGFMHSLERYAELRRERPDAEILMGTGNLTELTDADTTGITAMLLGICSELQHPQCARRAGQPAYAAHRRRARHRAAHDVRRARRRTSLPQGLHRRAALRCMRASRFPRRRRRLPRRAAEVRDKNFRIEIAEDGIHIFNRDGPSRGAGCLRTVRQARRREDGPHAFYLGAELTQARRSPGGLGKRYAQDEPLDWGVAADAPADDRTRLKEAVTR